MSQNDANMLLLVVAGVAGLAVVSWQLKKRAAARQGQPPPRFFPTISWQHVGLAILVVVLIVLTIAALILIEDLKESQPFLLAIAVSVVVAGGLVYLLFFEKRPEKNPKLQILADALGWSPDPRFRRRRFTVVAQEDVIRSWRGRRVGLSLREPDLGHGTPGHLSLTLQIADPHAPGGVEAQLPPTAQEQMLASVNAALEPFLCHRFDQVSLRKGRLKVRLGLLDRKVEYGEDWHVLSTRPIHNQFELVHALGLRVWEELVLVVE